MRCNVGQKVGTDAFMGDARMLVLAAVRMKAATLNADRTGEDQSVRFLQMQGVISCQVEMELDRWAWAR